MDFVHWQFNLKVGQVVSMTIDTQCDVFLVDDSNFSSFQYDGNFEYFGGAQKMRAVHIRVPRTGHWNLVLIPYLGSSVRYSNPRVI